MKKIIRPEKEIILLNPKERRDKYKKELKGKIALTNAGEIKTNKDGSPLELSDKQRAYRAGYLEAQNESARIYNKKNGIKKEYKRKKKN